MELRDLSINEIRVGYHPRKVFRGKEERKRKIAKEGLLEPLTVRKDGDNFVIIDGVMRFWIVQELGWKFVNCIIIDADEERSYHLAYIKNMERENLDPIEDALHLKTVQEKFGYNVEDLVRKGYAPHRSTLDDKLSLLTLPEDIQKEIGEGIVLNPSIGYELAKLPDGKSQRELAEEIIASGGMSVRKVKDKVQSLNVQRKVQGKGNPPKVEIPEGDIPGVFFKDSSDMSELADESVHLIVTSPPYGVGMEYEEGVSFDDHLKMLDRVFGECVRVLVPGGKICINFGDIHTYGTKNGGKPEVKLMGHHYVEILGKHGLRLLDPITWKKCHPGKKDSNWFTNPQVTYHARVRHGTYRFLRNTEHIFIFEKDGDAGRTYPPQISKDEWKQWVDSVWEIPPVKNQKDHPAQFPEEIPRRLIRMFSSKGEIVLDPFTGSGTTNKVARDLDRVGIGYEKDEKYKPFIMKKLGVKEEDLKKPGNKKPEAELSNEERKESIRTLRTEILPSILEETKSQGERISRLSFTLKPNLLKKDISVESVPVAEDSPPTSQKTAPQVSKADDYEETDHGEIRNSPLFTRLPSVKRANSRLLNRIVHGDAFDVIKNIEDESVDLWLTSPPYADVKNYGEKVGVVAPDEYVDWILPLFREIHRTLRATGSFILNINDCVVNKHRHPYVHELIFRSAKESPLKLYDTYFWIKKGTLPTGSEKRLNNWTEYLLHFCKEESSVKWNMDAVREPYDANTVSRCKYPVNTLNSEVDEKGKPKQRGRKLISLNPKGKRPSNVFNFPTAAAVRDKKHPAAFHIDLPTWFIKALTDEGDVVADVFAGSGTTCLAAKMLNRKFIGMELNPEYQKIAEERVGQPALAMAA